MYTGSNQLVKRLASQVGSMDLAIALLKKRGHMDSRGRLTKAGEARDAMTARERAIDRASKKSSHPKEDYVYNVRTNRATLKHRNYGKEKEGR